MKLGVYIGSFNPVHLGHIDVINYLLNEKIVDRVLVVPTGNYWNKTDLIGINDRVNMLKFFESNNIIIDNRHNNIPFTYQLMRELKKDYKDDLYLILGADNIISFDKWKNYEELLTYKIIVVNRSDIDIESCIKKYSTSNFIICKDYKPIDISSTFIRENLDCDYIDERVRKYIKDNDLYREAIV